MTSLQSSLSGKSLLLLASTVGAWWFISKEINRTKAKRKPKVPLFRDCSNPIRDGSWREEDSESDGAWEEKCPRNEDDELEEECFSIARPACIDLSTNKDFNGEGSPPQSSPAKKSKHSYEKELIHAKSKHSEKEQDISGQDTSGKHISEDFKETNEGIEGQKRNLLIRPSHTTETGLIENENPEDAEARRDSGVFFGLLNLYAKDNGREEPPSTPRRRESLILCRETLNFKDDESAEGDPFDKAGEA
mmetsp:Transcript_12676/g.17621  ORF Transcript_12676/g.17621 Transcript_12676/m.17621 type:complete len:248 (+) Transcript_12676:378-1121(+)|eukprot:CAMPEP_0185280458 /NCGR_PEP_ID=MMETSP1359-20130426/66136_1 /TAXON_ID=552665 /ORGANISM="Bigelowiella longifila, Strain CCMP242" /LENGTH=247 /DNA_ID=CAMNT_0027875713 /DNA_START=331 /DNA_END=1074 /DNA_ORIENTATION=-